MNLTRRRTLALLLAPLTLPACARRAPQFKATDISGSRIGSDFELRDHAGRPQQLSGHKGKVVIVTFGFTNCPDVCPTTLATLAQAVRKLGALGEKIQVFMVTVDPARDTPQALAHYVTAFDPRFISLVPDAESLPTVAAQFKVYIRANEPNESGFYTVDHTAASFVFDPQGRIRLFVPHEFTSDDWAADIAQLLAAS